MKAEFPVDDGVKPQHVVLVLPDIGAVDSIPRGRAPSQIKPGLGLERNEIFGSNGRSDRR